MLTKYVDGYQHFGIPANDIEATEKFYVSLGFHKKWETLYQGNRVEFFEYGNILVETYEKDGKSAGIRGAIDHIAMNCTDIEACTKEALAGEFKIVEGPCFLPYWEHGVKYICIEGPNQEIIEFIQKFKTEEESGKAAETCG
jgi:lactoylglutathione lyase